MDSIQSRVQQVRERIAAAARLSGRDPAAITLLAVSKTRNADEIRAAVAADCRCFGESYAQEAIAKMALLADLALEWHFIGPLQSNKTQLISQHFDWVHSVEREKIARRLNDQRPPQMPPLNVCIQVNISGEASKSGVTLAQVPALAAQISELPRLKLRGLMAIPQRTDPHDREAQRRAFHQLRVLFEQLNAQGLELDTLSMGMTHDLEAAILEGSTIVRVGSGLFGERPPRQPSRVPLNKGKQVNKGKHGTAARS
jgi:pyridoxal phosphate enzyme (YggS family)